MGAARVRLLGPVDVLDDDGGLVALGGPKERLVLAVLAVHAGEVVSEDRLIDALWGENPPRTAGKTLQSYVSRLRKALVSYEGVAIESASRGYVLRCEPGVRDVDRLEALLADGRRAAAAGDHDRAALRLVEAEQLWRGPVLGELAGEPFALGEAARLEELRTVVIEERIDAELATGRHAAVVAELESLTARYPLRERLWKARMLALYRSGRQAEALRAFQELRGHLAEELGIDPTPELTALEQAILVQSPELGSPARQPASRPEPETPPLPSGVVTFLMTDVEGSTALWERHPQDMDDALRAHDEAMSAAVAANGGVLIKARGEGDSTFSVFWRATDATAAAAAAQTAIADLDVAVPLLVRAAVHTGEAFERDGSYYGPAVNRAARLRDLAAGGETVVSRATAELVADHAGKQWELVELGERRLKDISRSEEVWALLPAGGAPLVSSMGGATGEVRPALPAAFTRYGVFVAREEEQRRLGELWDDVEAGSRHAAFIAGEPGIGKTALAATIACRAYDSGAIVLAGRCDEGLGVPHQPFAEAARSLITSGQVDVRRIPGGHELARLVPELGSLCPDLPAPTNSEPEADRWRLFEAVTALLSRTSAAAPLVLVLDDLHWAEKPTLLLLRHLLRSETPMRVLVIATYRDTELARSHPLADLLADLRRDGNVERISLSGFDDDDVARLVEATAGHDLDERAVNLARALRRETAGNPFFCAEVLRHLAESGVVFQADGRWTTDLPVDQLALPEGVREVIGRRLSRLSETANEVLRTAAVVGPTFSLPVMGRVVGISDDELLDVLDAAVASRLLNETPDGYEFAHALIRHTLLAELTATRTLRLHRRIGEALEALPERDRHIEAIARHFLDAATDGHEEKAATYALAAARQAATRAAFEEAATWVERGLEALDDQEAVHDDLRCDLWLQLSRSVWLAYDGRSRDAAWRAVEHARRTCDPERLAKAALLTRAEGVLGTEDVVSEAVLEEALSLLGTDHDALRVRLLSALANYRGTALGDRHAALAHSAGALKIARQLNDPELLLYAIRHRCAALRSCPGDHEGFALADELSALTSGDPIGEMERVRTVGGLALEVGDRDGFEACVVDMAELASNLAQGLPRMWGSYWSATLALLDGRWSEAADLEAPIDRPAFVIMAVATHFLAAREQGRTDELVTAMRDLAQANPSVAAFGAALAIQAVEEGDTEYAQTLVGDWVKSGFSSLLDDVTLSITLAMAAEAAVRVGNIRAIETLAERLEGFAGRAATADGSLCLGAVDRYRAMIAAVQGRFDEAEALFESALSLEECGLRSRVLATRTRLWYGRMLADKGDHDRARDMLRRTLADAEELAMAGIAAEAGELLELAGSHPLRP